MKNLADKREFNPSGIGLKNGNFIGLPYDEHSANVILIPIPWDVTASFGEGTAFGPQAIREASVQLDLFDTDVPDAWKLGLYMLPADEAILSGRNALRPKAVEYIDFLESGGLTANNRAMKKVLDEINESCEELNNKVYRYAGNLLQSGKIPGVIGGDHSVPLGLMKAIGEKYPRYGILHIDAHHDLRESYEGFLWSHASVFNNALKESSLSKLVQVGIRDFCEEEARVVNREGSRVAVFYDQQLRQDLFIGKNWNEMCGVIIDQLPHDVYISFDVDGLDPKLCPHTGTPVPGGIDFHETVYLFKMLVDSGRRIVGFDVCETGNHPWDSNVSARIIYKLSNLAGKSQGMI